MASQNYGIPIPILRIFDEAKAREFYLGFLGFAIDFEHRFEPGLPLYMGISKGACRFHLSEHHGDGTPGTRVRVEVPDVDALSVELVAKRYRNARPGVVATDWGTRESAIADPFGNYLVFYSNTSSASRPPG